MCGICNDFVCNRILCELCFRVQSAIHSKTFAQILYFACNLPTYLRNDMFIAVVVVGRCLAMTSAPYTVICCHHDLIPWQWILSFAPFRVEPLFESSSEWIWPIKCMHAKWQRILVSVSTGGVSKIVEIISKDENL